MMKHAILSLVLVSFLIADSQAVVFFRRRIVRRPTQPSTPRRAEPDPVPQPPDDGGDNAQIDTDALVRIIIDRIAGDPRFDREHSHPEHEHEAVDYDRIGSMIDEAIAAALATLPEPPQPEAKDDVVHFTVIASTQASYWRRIAPIVDRAKEAYHRIQVVEPPRQGPSIGPLPQVVEYRNSIPQRTHFSREAYETLERVARGTYPPRPQ